MEQQFNEQNSLQLIESMINRAKNNFSESGTLYLIWGIVIFVCSLSQFIGIHFFNYESIGYVWLLTWLVVIYQVFFLSKKAKKEKAKTYTADILKYVWICFAACLFMLIFILQFQHAFSSITPGILVLYGVPTFLSGAILKFRSLVIGGICCWALSVGAVFVPLDFQSLFICAAVLVAWIIPGLLLRKRYQSSMAAPGLHSFSKSNPVM
jgi:hypothetical protein